MVLLTPPLPAAGRREFGGRREHDWVVRGEHIASDKLQEARRQWKTFLGLSPQYPEKARSATIVLPVCLTQR